MRIKITYIFFWCIGLASIYFLSKVLMSYDSRILLIEFRNPLIRYSLFLTFAFLTIAIMALPIFIHLGLKSGYADADKQTQKFLKAKFRLIIGIFSAPAWIFLCVAAIHMSIKIWYLFIFPGCLLFDYFFNIKIILKYKEQRTV